MERHLHQNKMVFGENTSQNVVDGRDLFLCVSDGGVDLIC